MEKEIHIFDMDDALFETPTFAEFVGAKNGEHIDTSMYKSEYFEKIRAAFWDILSKEVSFVRMNDFVVPLNNNNGKPFSGDIINYFSDEKYKKIFEVHNGVLALQPFPGFHKDPETLGLILNEPIFKYYEEAKNRMILTGREEALRSKIMYILRYLGIKYPNCGLQLFQNNSGKSIQQYKTNEILQTIKTHSWTTVHFYEDRKDWLTAAQKAVNTTFRGVNFVAHLITNVKDKRRLNE